MDGVFFSNFYHNFFIKYTLVVNLSVEDFMKKYILVLFLLFSSSLFSHQGLISKLYCQALGNEDVQLVYRNETHQALKEMSVPYHVLVPVKKMNRVGPIIACTKLSSFTAFGIWLDETFLDSCSKDERIFHMYHEAAHYALRHHQKILGSGATMLALTGVVLVGLHKYFTYTHTSHNTAKTIGTGAVLPLLSLYLLPKMVKKQEKNADLLAAKVLIESGRGDIVKKHIEVLKHAKSSEGAKLWWYSTEEQINYLEKLS